MLGAAIGFGIVTASITIIASIGITVQFSVTNYINFAYGTLLMIAVYVAGTAWSAGVGFWPGAAAGVAAAGLLSFCFGRLLDRWFVKRGSTVLVILVVTFGIYMVMQGGFLSIWGSEYRTFPFVSGLANRVGPFLWTAQNEYIIVTGVVVSLATWVLLRRTSIGRQLRAISDNPALASSSGINVGRMTDVVWMISGALAGIAGIALAADVGTYNPATSDTFLFLFFATVVVGGIGDVYGAMLAGLLLGLATEVSTLIIDPGYKYMVALIALIAITLVRPQGILGTGRARVR